MVSNCPNATDADKDEVFECYGHRPKHLDCNDIVIAWAVGGVVSKLTNEFYFNFIFS